MFCGVFSPFEGVAGLYRAPIPQEVLGVEERSLPLQVAVYPNPANDNGSLEFPKAYEIQGELRITDAIGRVIYNKSMDNETSYLVIFSVNTCPSGLYFYSIVGSEKKISGKFSVK